MPRGDRTGPNGMGPMTGRGAGFCAGSSVPGYANAVCGGRRLGGFGRGAGLGRGFGRGFAGVAAGMFGGTAFATPSPEQELSGLKSQAEYLEGALNDIKSRIKELDKQ